MKIKIGKVELYLKCILFGHKDNNEDGTLGYPCCERCDTDSVNAFEYSAETGEIDAWAFTIPYQFDRLLSRLKRLFTVSKCHDCGKLNEVCGFEFGNHETCLPF